MKVLPLFSLLLMTLVIVKGNPQLFSSIVDLTWDLSPSSHKWPTNPDLERSALMDLTFLNSRNESVYVRSDLLIVAEHTGTHLDAPGHFSKTAWDNFEIPPERLILPAVVINMQSQAAADSDYLVSGQDLLDWENQYGQIPAESLVLFDFGWASKYRDERAYFGTTNMNDTTSFHFPGLSLEAGELLAERGIWGIGTDTASVDYGQSQHFDVHHRLLGMNIYFLENVANLPMLPEAGKGVTVSVGLLKTVNGTGAPVRLLAMLPPENACVTGAASSSLASVLVTLLLPIGINFL